MGLLLRQLPENEKNMGKLVEKQGRKAMGLRDEASYDCQVAVWLG